MSIPQNTADAPAWSRDDLADPHARPDKPARVRRMFAAIARSYDLNNRLHSLGLDQAWRRAAVRAARVRPGDRVLDVACGTGDLSLAFLRSPAAQVTGLDFTPEMLRLAERKRARLAPALAARVSFLEGDALSLPFPDASFDVVSIAFGIRNVADPARALAQFARVLAPAGRLVILEFDRPRSAPARVLSDFYCGWLMPRTASLVSRDRSGAYLYLPRSVSSFMSRDDLAALIRASGFSDLAVRTLCMGICACYAATRSTTPPPSR